MSVIVIRRLFPSVIGVATEASEYAGCCTVERFVPFWFFIQILSLRLL